MLTEELFDTLEELAFERGGEADVEEAHSQAPHRRLARVP